MNKISSLQLFTLLIGMRTFEIICSPQAVGAEQMAGAALSILFQVLTAIPMIALYRTDGFSLKKEMLFGNVGRALYFIFFILIGAVSFENMWGVAKSVYFPVDSSIIGAVLLAAVSLYAASFKLKPISRYGTIMLGTVVISVAVMLIGAYPKAELANFIPSVSFSGIIKNAVRDFCSSGELAALFVLLDFSDKKREKWAYRFFSWSLVLTEVIYAVEITVLGRIMRIADYPFFTAGSLSQPMSIQRADSLYMIVFTMLCVMTVTIRIVLSSIFLRQIFPKLKYSELISTVLMAGLSAGMTYLSFDLSAVTGILTLILALAVPIIMLIRRKTGNEKTYSDNGSASAA